jgi:hypothetical protein
MNFLSLRTEITSNETTRNEVNFYMKEKNIIDNYS